MLFECFVFVGGGWFAAWCDELIGVQTPGRTLTPMYCAKARWLVNSFWVVAMISCSIFSIYCMDMVLFWNDNMLMALKVVGFDVMSVLGLHWNIFDSLSSFDRTDGVLIPRPSST